MSTLIAYHGDPKIKAKFLRRVEAHHKADQIIKGTYGEAVGETGWKGCAVGCTIHGSSHKAYEDQLGIPRVIARLEDIIFERLPDAGSVEWPGQFLTVINPGANLSMVWPQFAIWLLTDENNGVLRNVFQPCFAKRDQMKKAISDVSSLYSEWLATGVSPEIGRWRTARDAATTTATAASTTATAAYAYAAYAYAAYAAYAAAAYAAYAAYAAAAAAAYAAYADAVDAADAADAADACRNARDKFWVAASEKLLQLLADSPVPTPYS